MQKVSYLSIDSDNSLAGGSSMFKLDLVHAVWKLNFPNCN